MDDGVDRVVMYSGGIGSWAAAKRVAEWYGTRRLKLLFADTKIEDEDLYRFLDESATNVGGELIKIADGRTPWQVFRDVGVMGNTRIDPCSRILKRELLDRWLAKNCDPDKTVVYVGIDWSEEHRIARLSQRKAEKGWIYTAPMCEAPYLTKRQMLDALKREGIDPPRLYAMGFPHNNCGGFCVKAGQSTFAKLLEFFPQRYAEHEKAEAAFMRDFPHQGYTIMRDRRKSSTKPLTMKAFRERVQSGQAHDRFDFGGCGCAVDDGDEEARNGRLEE